MPRIFPLAIVLLATAGAAAQPAPPAHQAPKDCPPGVGSNAPGFGDASKGSLSEKLASSKGIICPPAGIDPEMHQKPPEGGAIKVIPPPGTPGGDPRVQPK